MYVGIMQVNQRSDRLKTGLRPAHTDVFFMRCVAICHDASIHIRGRIVTDRNATHENASVWGRGLVISFYSGKNAHAAQNKTIDALLK